MPNPDNFIVIEGTDGSGKSTQTKLLLDWLHSQGRQIFKADFPRYDEPSAYFVKKYLAGDYGELADNGPYKASLFYALDRFDAASDIRTALADGKFVIADRYVGSNMGHQGAQISDASERRKYFSWIEDLEYNILGIPRPGLNIFLDMPPAAAHQLITDRGRPRDLQENDPSNQQRVYEVYSQMCELFRDSFTKIKCATSDTPRPVDAIQTDIQNLVRQRFF